MACQKPVDLLNSEKCLSRQCIEACAGKAIARRDRGRFLRALPCCIFQYTVPAMVCLTTSKLFRGMLADELPALEQTARLQAYRAGSNVFQEGDPGDGLYIIVEGKVQITCLVDQEQRRVLSELGPGDFFGEMAVLDNQ